MCGAMDGGMRSSGVSQRYMARLAEMEREAAAQAAPAPEDPGAMRQALLEAADALDNARMFGAARAARAAAGSQ